MTDLIRRVDAPATLTRREFTLEAALALLAGCVITISDAACSSSTSPTAPPTDLTGAIYFGYTRRPAGFTQSGWRSDAARATDGEVIVVRRAQTGRARPRDDCAAPPASS